MLKASEFMPIAFEATAVGFNLSASRSKLAARLLNHYGDRIDDITELGFTRRKQSYSDEFQIMFGSVGFLTVDHIRAKVECGFPAESGPGKKWIPERVNWAVDLLSLILDFHKQRACSLWFEMTWLLWEESSTTRLIDQLGLTRSLNGFFAASQEFEIRGDSQTELPGLFPVTCELTMGRMVNYEPPEDIGVQLKYRSPDNRHDDDYPVDYSRETLDLFFATAPEVMYQQFDRLFPDGEAP
ncbi:hypothetical protein J8F10_25530 [Gemmata sp. G18]|uniref:TIGR04255 family protein n=1 Tax=Gemmata palustris TaxID=2822762 RepID=A0ABS5BY90_9BACT|nr:hypothetical protein [Gemmata palustris]MBP3958623.1 hypothetical protein [Gemmata palustris]